MTVSTFKQKARHFSCVQNQIFLIKKIQISSLRQQNRCVQTTGGARKQKASKQTDTSQRDRQNRETDTHRQRATTPPPSTTQPSTTQAECLTIPTSPNLAPLPLATQHNTTRNATQRNATHTACTSIRDSNATHFDLLIEHLAKHEGEEGRRSKYGCRWP
jgi:hypothetical protein